MMRPMLALAAVLLAAAPASAAAAPADWHAKARDLLARTVAIPTVKGRGKVPEMAELLAAELRAAGWPADDVRVIPYEGDAGDRTAALIARWRAPGRAAKRPIMLMGHMDVVEARREDWSMDPFTLVEKDGYLYGRGTSDIKQGIVATTVALMRLRAEGFRPRRDLILFFTGDEETAGNGAILGATTWKPLLDVEYGLNADGGGGGFSADGTAVGFSLQTAEKTYADYRFAVRNPGGHSSKPRPDNAIYQLSAALTRLGAHRFAPALNETTRAYFRIRQQGDASPVGEAIRRWLADPADGAAADVVEADPGEVGLTRTRCVATMLSGGHAPNALPQLAEATVNCRILPGVSPDAILAELRAVAGSGVEVTRLDDAVASLGSPLRPDILAAYTDAVRSRHPGAPVMPEMSTGASDARPFRVAGVPVYGVDGSWGVVPDDLRAHGRDERLPVKALGDDVDHFHRLVTTLAGR